ncbi:MAG: DUF362 domain-containing protein [Candidatus Methylacidiphilales bacterium]
MASILSVSAQTPLPRQGTEESSPQLGQKRIPGFVLVHSPSMVSRFKSNPDQVALALEKGLSAWSGKSNSVETWKSLVKPGERVGIRINTVGGPITSTHLSLVQKVIDGLLAAGIRPGDIIVWDKYPHHMMSAGYVPLQPKEEWQCQSIVEGSGWDPEVFYFHETVGRLIWGDHEFKGRASISIPIPETEDSPSTGKPEDLAKNEQISNRSYFARVVTRSVDKIINMPTMTNHEGTGIQGCLASLALGSVDNHRRFLDGTEPSATAIAEILSKDPIAQKTILHIMDGLIMQYAAGPGFDPNFADSAAFLLIGNDPVAIDSWVLQQMEFRRQDRSVVPIGAKADHIRAAESFGLGRRFTDETVKTIQLP